MASGFDDDYDGGWAELQDSGDFGEWLIDDDSMDPELNGQADYDELAYEYDDESEADWDLPEPVAPVAFAVGLSQRALPPGALRFGSTIPARRLDTPEDPEVWHLTHLSNFQLMCERGTLSPTPECPWGVRPGDQQLVSRRAHRPTELGPRVGDCVPFYFTVATPFSYRVLTPGWVAQVRDAQGVRTITTRPEHYVFLRSTVRSLVHPNGGDWMITNGNAATASTLAWRSLDHLDCVNWSAVRARWSPANQAERQAELLVARSIDLRNLTSVHCASEQFAALARSQAGPFAGLVVEDPSLFARARGWG